MKPDRTLSFCAQVWTAEEAGNNTVVSARLHLRTEQTKRAMLISSALWLGNPQPVIDKWENHTASASRLRKVMNIHVISFGQEAFYTGAGIGKRNAQFLAQQ